MKTLMYSVLAAASLTLGTVASNAAPLPVQTLATRAPIVRAAMSSDDHMMMHHKMMRHKMMMRHHMMRHKMMMHHHMMMHHGMMSSSGQM